MTTLLLVFVRTRHTRFGNFVEKDETTSSVVWGTAQSVAHFYKCEPTWDRADVRTPWFSEVAFPPLEQEEISPKKRWVKYRRTVVTPTQLILKKK